MESQKASVVLIPLPLPNESILYKAASRYRESRLRALRADPETFASNYEQEEAYPMEAWTARIENKHVKTFVLVEKHTGHEDIEKLLDQPWLGSVILLGPKVKGAPEVSATEPPWNAFIPPHVPSDGQEGVYALPILEYHIVGMFVLPDARRRGLGKKLVQNAISSGLTQGKALGAKSVKISVLVDTKNDVALGLYKSTGFVTLKEEEFEDERGLKKIAYFMEQELSVP
jgi:ribosomal protein S18 acetylase RimI-like enzyme